MKEYRNKWDQVVGTLSEGVFRKRVSGAKHLFKNEQGWGIDKSILLDLPPKTEIRILDKDDNTVYLTTKEIFMTHSEIDFGHGPQIIMWKKHFDTKKGGVLTKSPYVEGWLADYAFFEAFDPVEYRKNNKYA